MSKLAKNAATIALLGVLFTPQAGFGADDETDPAPAPTIPEETIAQIETVLEECQGEDTTQEVRDAANKKIYELLVPHYVALDPDMDIIAHAAARMSAEEEVALTCGPADEAEEQEEPFTSPLEL